MLVHGAMLQALRWSDRIGFSVTPALSCRKGHLPCLSVMMVCEHVTETGHVKRVEGPFPHQTIGEALDLVATLAAAYSSALELREQLESMDQLSLDLEDVN